MFVPREEITLVDGTEEEEAEPRKRKEEFFREKGAHKLTTRCGLQYSPHYAQPSSKNREG